MTVQANRRAAYLALECDLDWGRWATTPIPSQEIVAFLADPTDPSKRDAARAAATRGLVYPAVPEDITEWHAPYLAECERRGVTPGPLPSLCWGADDSDPVLVDVTDTSATIVIRSATGGHARVQVGLAGTLYFGASHSRIMAADLTRLAQLVSAIERADKDGGT